MKLKKMSDKLQTTKVNDLDLLDAVCLCHAALAQDSPNPPRFYINQIMNMFFGYLDVSQRMYIDEYLAEKKYLPETTIEIAK